MRRRGCDGQAVRRKGARRCTPNHTDFRMASTRRSPVFASPPLWPTSLSDRAIFSLDIILKSYHSTRQRINDVVWSNPDVQRGDHCMTAITVAKRAQRPVRLWKGLRPMLRSVEGRTKRTRGTRKLVYTITMMKVGCIHRIARWREHKHDEYHRSQCQRRGHNDPCPSGNEHYIVHLAGQEGSHMRRIANRLCIATQVLQTIHAEGKKNKTAVKRHLKKTKHRQ